MKELSFVYLCGLPWNGRIWIQEGLSGWSQLTLRGFYTVSYYDTQGNKIWDIIGLLPQDFDTLFDSYDLKPVKSYSALIQEKV